MPVTVSRGVHEYLHNLEWGPARSFENLLFIPFLLRPHAAPHPQTYLPLGQALMEGHVQIKETNRVSALHVTSTAKQPVFGLAGSYLKGGGQDRMLAVSVVLAPQVSGDLPTRCVEQRRWNGQHGQMFATPATGSLVSSSITVGSSHVDQRQVWETVADLAASTDTQTGTTRLGEVYAHKRATLEEYKAALLSAPVDDRAVGSLFFASTGGIRGYYSLDLFGRPELFRSYLEGLCEGAAITASTLPRDDVSIYQEHPHDVDNMCHMVLANVETASVTEETIPVSDGQLLAGESKAGAAVAILNHGDEPLHTLLRWHYHSHPT